MQAIKILALVLLSLVLSSAKAYAKFDKELQESRKCSSAFSYFEQKYRLPPNSLHPISLHETAKKHSKHDIVIVWPWTVMNNQEGKGYHFKTQQEAVRYAREQFMLGNNNLDVGCMQINLKHHPEAFSSLSNAFSPRKNVSYGAYFLSENLKKLGSIDKAIGRYHSATEELAKKYHSNVIKIKQNMSQYHDNLRRVTTISNHKTSYKNSRYADLYLPSNQAIYKKKFSDKSPYTTQKVSKVKNRSGKIPSDNWYKRKVN